MLDESLLPSVKLVHRVRNPATGEVTLVEETPAERTERHEKEIAAAKRDQTRRLHALQDALETRARAANAVKLPTDADALAPMDTLPEMLAERFATCAADRDHTLESRLDAAGQSYLRSHVRGVFALYVRTWREVLLHFAPPLPIRNKDVDPLRIFVEGQVEEALAECIAGARAGTWLNWNELPAHLRARLRGFVLSRNGLPSDATEADIDRHELRKWGKQQRDERPAPPDPPTMDIAPALEAEADTDQDDGLAGTRGARIRVTYDVPRGQYEEA